jgi:hypothetical protein
LNDIANCVPSTIAVPPSSSVVELAVPLDDEAMAEIANALHTKERLVRSGFYDETADGCDIAGWATLLERLGECFG